VITANRPWKVANNMCGIVGANWFGISSTFLKKNHI
jgi:hypothetical protein